MWYAMTFSLSCDCGKSLEVTASQAGTNVPCSCGRAVSVPLLSQLRQLAGQAAYEAGTIDTINRMIRDGELPHGDTCAISGLPTLDSYDLYVQCESKWTKGPGTGRYLFVIFTILFLPFWVIWVFVGKALLDEERQVLGSDRGVYTPLRVRQEYHQQLRRNAASATCENCCVRYRSTQNFWTSSPGQGSERSRRITLKCQLALAEGARRLDRVRYLGQVLRNRGDNPS